MPRPADPTLRERLIAAATAEFAASGYSGATLDAIAARAGVTKGGLYFHFDGKEELFFAVLDHWRELRRRELQVQGPVTAGGGASLKVASSSSSRQMRSASIICPLSDRGGCLCSTSIGRAFSPSLRTTVGNTTPSR